MEEWVLLECAMCCRGKGAVESKSFRTTGLTGRNKAVHMPKHWPWRLYEGVEITCGQDRGECLGCRFECLTQIDCTTSGGTMMNECRAIFRTSAGRGNRSTLRKPTPVPLSQPQIPSDIIWIEPVPPQWEAGESKPKITVWRGPAAI
jgi:hypothetical protein